MADRLREARARERTASLAEAATAYEAVIRAAERTRARAVLAEALRRLAIVRHRQGRSAEARELGRRSYDVARRAGRGVLAGEALNALGVFDLETDGPDEARRNFLRALELGGQSPELRARAEQNLGILANIQGDLGEALVRYGRSLEAYRALNDEHGCALAYHNLGMVSADRREFEYADRYFRQSSKLAQRAADPYLQGLCLVNHAKVHVTRGRYEAARDNAEAALMVFDRLGVASARADACRILGMVYRETGQPQLAESRLRSAIELAASAGSALNQAEASRELAVLCQTMGRNQDALTLLNAAHRLFGRVDARSELVDVDAKMAELEATFLAMVSQWGRSIESGDTYTFGHCERVASGAVAVARSLGMDPGEQTTIRLGAYLHDLGKVKVPPEILRKPGRLTNQEFAVLQMHPAWGIELLAGVEFPWDLKPIIRWHHEKYDGTGYPDQLPGDAIPISAQIVGIVDVYDALTTARPYRPALPPEDALAEIRRCRAWWSPAVYAGFLASVTRPQASASGGQPAAPSAVMAA